MVDIWKWYKCKKEQPKRRGSYILLIGVKGLGGWVETHVVEATWNGHNWVLDSGYIPMQWTYYKKEKMLKYPIFNMNQEVYV